MTTDHAPSLPPVGGERNQHPSATFPGTIVPCAIHNIVPIINARNTHWRRHSPVVRLPSKLCRKTFERSFLPGAPSCWLDGIRDRNGWWRCRRGWWWFHWVINWLNTSSLLRCSCFVGFPCRHNRKDPLLQFRQFTLFPADRVDLPQEPPIP